jgi:Fungal Zn(2)-Cys(6) binuclear cluster domain
MRHLKCDETRPSCKRCEKGGFECRGYDVIDVFVDERTRILERCRKPRVERRQPSELSLIRRPRVAARAQKPEASRSEVSPNTALPTVADSRQLSASLPLTVLFPLNEDEIYLTFMRNKLVTNLPGFRLGNRFLLMDHEMTRLSWLAPPLDGHTLSAPLHPALHALARAWFARLQDQPEIAAQGTMYYGKALRELKDTISNDRWRGRDVLIAYEIHVKA